MQANIFWLFPDQQIQRLEAYRLTDRGVLIGATNGLPNELPTSERLMGSVLDSFHAYPAHVTFVGSGFGVQGGVVQRAFENNEFTEATVRIQVPEKTQPLDIKYTVSTYVYADAGHATLATRALKAEASALLMKAQTPTLRMKTLRNTARTVAGLHGEEYFVTSTDSSRGRGYSVHAEFEFGGRASDPFQPYVQIVLDVDDVPSSVPAAALLKSWDESLNSAYFAK